MLKSPVVMIWPLVGLVMLTVGGSVKFAVTALLELMTSKIWLLEPEALPVQLPSTYPGSGTAVIWTVVLEAYEFAEGLRVTVPGPLSSVVNVKLFAGRAVKKAFTFGE